MPSNAGLFKQHGSRSSARGIDSSSSSSSASSSEESLLDSDDDVDAASKGFAAYFTAAARRPRHDRHPGGLSARSSERLGAAIAKAKANLLLKDWEGLLDALKRLESGLRSCPSARTLGWRLPVIVRLLEDALSASRAAMPSKRDMSAGQAKAVVAITNKIERDIRIAHWAHEMVSIQPNEHPYGRSPRGSTETALIDSLELILLSPGHGTLHLEGFGLRKLPESLRYISGVLDWYAMFGDFGATIATISALDVSRNDLEDLPAWLPEALPALAYLDIRQNSRFNVLPPWIVRFKEMTKIVQTPSSTSAANSVQALARAHKKAVERTSLPPLVNLCMSRLPEEDRKYAPQHLLDQLGKGYHCINCKQFLLPVQPTYIDGNLRESILLWPRSDTPDAQPEKGGIKSTVLTIGGPSWRFCAPCLVAHFTQNSPCACTICREIYKSTACGLVLDRDQPWLR